MKLGREGLQSVGKRLSLERAQGGLGGALRRLHDPRPLELERLGAGGCVLHERGDGAGQKEDRRMAWCP